MEQLIPLDNLPATGSGNIIERYSALIRKWKDRMGENTAKTYCDFCERNIVLLEHECEIMRSIDKIGSSYIRIGMYLSEIKDQNLAYGIADHDSGVTYYTFEDYASGRFGLSRSGAYTLIGVYKTYADPATGKLLREYQDYSYSQLVEMLPLDSADRSTISPTMTVKEIRQYRKRLELQASPDWVSPPTIEAPVTVTAPEVLSGQLEIETVTVETVTVESVPTSGQSDAETPDQSSGITYWSNDKQRRAWLDTYRDWPLWLSVPQLKLDVYRVGLTDGYTILAYEYTVRAREGLGNRHRSVNYMLFAPGEEIVLDYYPTAPTYIVQHLSASRAGAYWTEAQHD